MWLKLNGKQTVGCFLFLNYVGRRERETRPFSLSPLQLVDLLLLVVLLIFSLPQDLQEPLHLRLRLPGVLFVLGHFLLQAGYASGEFSAGLGIGCCTLSLEQKLVIANKQSVSFSN